MRMSALLCVAGLALAGTASAATPHDNANAKRDVVAASPAASAAAATKQAGDVARGSLNVSSTKGESPRADPYAVPLFKDAKQMR